MGLRTVVYALLASLILALPTIGQNEEAPPSLPPQTILFPVEVPTKHIGTPGDSAYVSFYTPADLDAMLSQKLLKPLTADQEALRREVVQHFNAERAALKKNMSKKYKQPVMIIMVAVMTHDDNTLPFVLWPDYEIGLRRGLRDIPSLATHQLLWVEPGDTGNMYVVLPKTKLQLGDMFYLKIPGKNN